ncbi:MAG: TonB-dependent receptor [Planctomycetes bacterium]|nr:TonB-dependent receptor [Planctomycetota bacterium]
MTASRPRCAPAIVLMTVLAAPSGSAPGANAPKGEDEGTDLTLLSLEELMDIEVTTVSKKREKLLEAPAAVTVITGDDLRRSGARTLPDALRLAPGINVAQIDANKWAVGARGFLLRFSTKLLVLRDGRSIYTPIFSGVYWDAEDTMFEDIDRIEVIRGPGGTLWGANAVNGVINILSKSARETQGLLVNGGAGTEERAFFGARYGGALSERAHYRIYAKYFYRDGSEDTSGHDTRDDWETLRGGFRVDWDMNDDDALMVQGDAYGERIGNELTIPTLTPPYATAYDDDGNGFGGDLLARWTRQLSDTSELAIQAYYDRLDREEPVYGVVLDTADLDIQHRFSLGTRHEILWGFNYRTSTAHADPSSVIAISHRTSSMHLLSAFAQDTIELVQDRLRLTLGSKFDYNDYTGIEIQPSARIAWLPHERHTVWGAVSRAVRTPAVWERHARFHWLTYPPDPPGVPLPTRVSITGDLGVESEDLLALEMGYRVRPEDSLSVDFAAFCNLYEDLVTLEGWPVIPDPGPPAHLVYPLIVDNKLDGRTWGAEIEAEWKAARFWRLSGGFSLLHMNFRRDPGSSDESEGTEGYGPRHQVFLRSMFDLPFDFEFDANGYYVDSLRSVGAQSYIRLDLRLGWRPSEAVEASVVVQNVLDSRHREFVSELYDNVAEIERSVYGMVTLRF